MRQFGLFDVFEFIIYAAKQGKGKTCCGQRHEGVGGSGCVLILSSVQPERTLVELLHAS